MNPSVVMYILHSTTAVLFLLFDAISKCVLRVTATLLRTIMSRELYIKRGRIRKRQREASNYYILFPSCHLYL